MRDMINPLSLQIRPGTQDIINENEVLQSHPDPPYNMTTRRRKRDAEMIIRPEQHIDRDGHKRQVINMVCPGYNSLFVHRLIYICLFVELPEWDS